MARRAASDKISYDSNTPAAQPVRKRNAKLQSLLSSLFLAGCGMNDLADASYMSPAEVEQIIRDTIAGRERRGA